MTGLINKARRCIFGTSTPCYSCMLIEAIRMRSSASSQKWKDVEHNLVLKQSQQTASVGLINILLVTDCGTWLAVLHVVLIGENVSRNQNRLSNEAGRWVMAALGSALGTQGRRTWRNPEVKLGMKSITFQNNCCRMIYQQMMVAWANAGVNSFIPQANNTGVSLFRVAASLSQNGEPRQHLASHVINDCYRPQRLPRRSRCVMTTPNKN